MPPQSDANSWPSKSVDAPHHFLGGFVGEGEQQDPVGRNSLFQQISDAIGEGAGFARAGAGDDERRSGRRGDGGVLLLVQLRGVINLQIHGRLKWLQHIITRHQGSLISWDADVKLRSGRVTSGSVVR